MALDIVKRPVLFPSSMIDMSSTGPAGLFDMLVSLVREQYRIHGRDPDAAGFEAERATFTLRAPRSPIDGDGDFYTVMVPGELLERADLRLIAEEFYQLAYPEE